MCTVVLIIVLVFLIIYLGMSAIIAYFVASPSLRKLKRTPADLGLKYEDVQFRSRSDNVLLRGWYLPGGEKGTIIVIHGGKQDRADASMRLLELCADLSKQGFNVLTFDRRGYGASEVPHRTLRGCFVRDAEGAVDFIRGRSPNEKIYLLGTSIGAVTALATAAENRGILSLITDSCFASTPEMMKRTLRKTNRSLVIFMPGALLMGRLVYCFEPISAIDYAGRVDRPILFIHGEKDSDIPVTDTISLYEASNNPRSELWIVPDAAHSQAYARCPGEYVQRVVNFLAGKD